MIRNLTVIASSLALLVATSGSADPSARPVQDCVCIGESLLAPITTFLPCIDPSTLNFGVVTLKGNCPETCIQTLPCAFGVYASASPPAGCGSNCDSEFLAPGYVDTWGPDVYAQIIPDCGAKAVQCLILSRCKASCAPSCQASGQTAVFGACTVKCNPCTPVQQ